MQNDGPGMKRRTSMIVLRLMLAYVPTAIVVFVAWVWAHSRTAGSEPNPGSELAMILSGLFTYSLSFLAFWYVPDPEI